MSSYELSAADAPSLKRSGAYLLSPAIVVISSCAAGVALPILYYIRRLSGDKFLWELPSHHTPSSAIVFAMAGAIVFASLPQFELRRAFRISLNTAALALVAGLCWRWRFQLVLGDGKQWLPLASDPFIMGSEPLGRWMHYIGYRVAGLFGEASGEQALRLSSVAAGAAWLAGVLHFVPQVFHRSRIMPLVLLLFASPLMVLFTGYYETTPWTYAFTGIYMLAGLRYLALNPARPPWIETIFIALAIWTHGMALFSAGAQAALIGCWYSSSNTAAQHAYRMRWGILLSIAPFAPLALTMLYAYVFGTGRQGFEWYGNAMGGYDKSRWVSFGERQSPTHFIFMEYEHVRDLVNLLLSASPLAILTPLAAIDLYRTRARELIFLGAGFIGLALFSVFWNSDYGRQWDFDLMSMFALPAMIIVALWWNDRLRPRVSGTLAMASAFAAFFTTVVPFVRFP